MASSPQLSERQMEIARLVADGLSYRDIGLELGISPFTVNRHIQNIGRLIPGRTSPRHRIGHWVRTHAPKT